ncbi:Replication initiator protein A (RepA) N-terminus [Eubacterium ruminantium]|nr:Replication initiator protein A (RepA) N-terminus [Eubacterium ruminantium]
MADTIRIPESFYFHGDEVSQFVYVQVPIALIKESVFRGISDSAKVLYGMLLNRMGLSLRNGWTDENGRSYINYTIEALMDDLGIGKTKAKALFAELSDINKTGVGLIRKERVLNKPSRIYVMNFVEVFDYLKRLQNEENTIDVQTETNSAEDDNRKNSLESTCLQVGRDCDPRSAANTAHGQPQIRPTVGRDYDPWSAADTAQNNNNNIYHNRYNNLSIKTENIKQGSKDEYLIEEMDSVRQLIKDNIEFDALVSDYGSTYEERINELVEIMVEACVLMKDVKIGGVTIPHSLIESRFEKYDMETMQYVLDSLHENTTKVRNVKKYLLSTLYNAPTTKNNQVSLMVNHDLYG